MGSVVVMKERAGFHPRLVFMRGSDVGAGGLSGHWFAGWLAIGGAKPGLTPCARVFAEGGRACFLARACH